MFQLIVLKVYCNGKLFDVFSFFLSFSVKFSCYVLFSCNIPVCFWTSFLLTQLAMEEFNEASELSFFGTQPKVARQEKVRNDFTYII